MSEDSSEETLRKSTEGSVNAHLWRNRVGCCIKHVVTDWCLHKKRLRGCEGREVNNWPWWMKSLLKSSQTWILFQAQPETVNSLEKTHSEYTWQPFVYVVYYISDRNVLLQLIASGVLGHVTAFREDKHCCSAWQNTGRKWLKLLCQGVTQQCLNSV